MDGRSDADDFRATWIQGIDSETRLPDEKILQILDLPDSIGNGDAKINGKCMPRASDQESRLSVARTQSTKT